MRATVFAALVLATSLSTSAGAHHAVPCAGLTAHEGSSVAALEARLRGVIRASAQAGCDPFGGMIGRPHCAADVSEIRHLAQQIAEAELNGADSAAGPCADNNVVRVGDNPSLLRGTVVSIPKEMVDAAPPSRPGAILADHSAAPVHTTPEVARPVPSDRRHVRVVGPAFLPDDDRRFEAIAKGRTALADSAATAIVSWIGFGSGPRDAGKGDRLPAATTVLTAAAE